MRAPPRVRRAHEDRQAVGGAPMSGLRPLRLRGTEQVRGFQDPAVQGPRARVRVLLDTGVIVRRPPAGPVGGESGSTDIRGRLLAFKCFEGVWVVFEGV